MTPCITIFINSVLFKFGFRILGETDMFVLKLQSHNRVISK